MAIKGWRTTAYGVLIGVIGAFSTPEMTAFIAEHLGWLSSIIGGGIVVLRALTTSAIFKSDPPPPVSETPVT